MAITYNGGGSANTTGATDTVTIAYSQTSGRCTVVVAGTNLTGQTVSSVTGGGATFSKVIGPFDTGTQAVEIWSTSASGSGSGGSVVVTWSTGGSQRRGACVMEYSGVTRIGANTANASGTGTSPSVSLTTTLRNSYLVGILKGLYDPSITATSGTVRQTINAGTNLSIVGIDNTTALIESLTISGTQLDSAGWVAAVIELLSEYPSLPSINSPSIPMPIMCM